MNHILTKIKEEILDITAPKKCFGCGKEGQYICSDCSLFLSEFNMFEAESPTPSLISMVSVWEYEGIIEKAILKIKYGGYHDIINELTDKAFEKIELNLPPGIHITYVPMYGKREKERGFNQSRLIAEKIGEKTGKPVVELLKKTADNRSQVGLNPQERLENVRNVFASKILKAEPPKLESVLLVDDVCTTGATMNECAEVLKKSGIKNVYGFTIARKLNL